MSQNWEGLPQWHKVSTLLIDLYEIIASGISWGCKSGLSMPPIGRTLECRLFSLALETLWPVIHCQEYVLSNQSDFTKTCFIYVMFYYEQLVHGGWMVPTPAAWNLKPRENGGIIPGWVQRPENQWNWWCKSQPKGRKRLMSQLSQPGRRERILSFSAFCSVQALSGLKDASLHWFLFSSLYFTESTDSNENLI